MCLCHCQKIPHPVSLVIAVTYILSELFIWLGKVCESRISIHFHAPSPMFTSCFLLSDTGVIAWSFAQGHLAITNGGESFTHFLAHMSLARISGCAILPQALSTCIALLYFTCPSYRLQPTPDLYLPSLSLPGALSSTSPSSSSSSFPIPPSLPRSLSPEIADILHSGICSLSLPSSSIPLSTVDVINEDGGIVGVVLCLSLGYSGLCLRLLLFVSLSAAAWQDAHQRHHRFIYLPIFSTSLQ